MKIRKSVVLCRGEAVELQAASRAALLYLAHYVNQGYHDRGTAERVFRALSAATDPLDRALEPEEEETT